MTLLMRRIRRQPKLTILVCLITAVFLYWGFTEYLHGDGNSRGNQTEATNDGPVDAVVAPIADKDSEIEIQAFLGKKHVRKAIAALEVMKKSVSYDVHIFYYAWYGTEAVDGKWLHWNHRYLAPWDKSDTRKYHTGRHSPPLDVGSNYYPRGGPYSSADPAVVERHMFEIRQAGIGVVALSWYPPGKSDDEGQPADVLTKLIMDKANKYGLKVTFHLEPYTGRNEMSVSRDVRYIIKNYGAHPAMYKRAPGKTSDARKIAHKERKRRGAAEQQVIGGLHDNNKNGGKWQDPAKKEVDLEQVVPDPAPLLPVFYIYDSYQTPAESWRRLLGGIHSDGEGPDGLHAPSLRGTPNDGIFFSLIVESSHVGDAIYGGFDGAYTYFASDTFVWGSRPGNWAAAAQQLRESFLMFSPSVGPGYTDTEVRPWNGRVTRMRQTGTYYRRMWMNAMGVQADVVSVTSYNEWHEGTQIEPADGDPGKRKWEEGETPGGYLTYSGGSPEMYLGITREMVEIFVKSKDDNH